MLRRYERFFKAAMSDEGLFPIPKNGFAINSTIKIPERFKSETYLKKNLMKWKKI